MMSFESIDRIDEPITDEFEKLEFLPEQPADDIPAPDDTTEIDFTPEDESADEPPVSFSPASDEHLDLSFDPDPIHDLGDSLPFELVGTSLFDDADLDDDFDNLEHHDFDDDLEF